MNLPNSLIHKIFIYNIHPVAELIKPYTKWFRDCEFSFYENMLGFCSTKYCDFCKHAIDLQYCKSCTIDTNYDVFWNKYWDRD